VCVAAEPEREQEALASCAAVRDLGAALLRYVLENHRVYSRIILWFQRHAKFIRTHVSEMTRAIWCLTSSCICAMVCTGRWLPGVGACCSVMVTQGTRHAPPPRWNLKP
jgi:hypothetical protein